MTGRELRIEGWFEISVVISVSFGVGYWFAKHDWIEVLIAVSLTALCGAVLAWQVKRHPERRRDPWET